MADTMIASGAICCWWDSADKAGTKIMPSGHALPVCPNCGGPLMQSSELEWNEAVADYNREQAGYAAMMGWSRGKCYPNFAALNRAYANRSEP